MGQRVGVANSMLVDAAGAAAASEPCADSLHRDREQPRILLLVEDNRADVFLIEQAIEYHQVPVDLVVAEDGEIALEYFERAQQDRNVPQPAILLLDLSLPKKSGAEVLARVRGIPQFRELPVVVLTSSDSFQDRLEADRLGADRYFRKPPSYHEFLRIGAVLNEVLQQRTR